MIKLLIVGLLAGFTPKVFALNVDSFNCKTTISKNGKIISTQESNFELGRFFKQASPVPGTGLTSSNYTLDTSYKGDSETITYSPILYYDQILKYGDNKEITEARQQSCLASRLTVCLNGSCNAVAETCLWSPEPFDPARGWHVVPVHDNIPVFDEKFNLRSSVTLTDKDSIVSGSIECKWLGTWK